MYPTVLGFPSQWWWAGKGGTVGAGRSQAPCICDPMSSELLCSGAFLCYVRYRETSASLVAELGRDGWGGVQVASLYVVESLSSLSLSPAPSAVFITENEGSR